MKTNQEAYNVMKLLAEDISKSRATPKHLERYVKIVIDDDGKDKVVRKFSYDMTAAAILVAMVHNVEQGLGPLSGFVFDDKPKKPVAVEDVSQETQHDEFTAAALAQIPPGKPDSSTLNPPRAKVKVKASAHPERKEGEYWIDDKGRHWKIIEGRKVQQKKPKV